MVLKVLNTVQKHLLAWVTLSICLLLMASCTASPTAPPPPSGAELATYQLEIDLLGTKHEVSVDIQGRLKTNVELSSADGKISLSLKEGTIVLDKDGRPLQFIHMATDPTLPLPPADAQIIGTVYDLTPHGATSNPPLMLTLPYRLEDIPEDVQEKDLYIVPYDEENGWGKSFYKKIDTENHRVTAQVSTFSKYVILAAKEVPPPPSLTMTSLEEALSNGRPTIAEFGSSKCIPCKMMKPVLENLAIMFERELNVVIIEVYEQMSLARGYKIMSIPTQVIFDENGQEITRHIGYWPKEEIIAQLKKMGIE